MNSSRYVLLLLSVFIILKVADVLQVQFESNIVGNLDSNDTALQCSFIKDNTSEEIRRLLFIVQNVETNNFVEIAQFRPRNNPSIFLPGGNYLKPRATLSAFLPMTTVATLTFKSLKCEDDTKYQCQIDSFTTAGVPRNDIKATDLSVRVNPSSPHIEWNELSVFDGNNITLSCVGNVGKPPGTFIWQSRNGSSISHPYRNVTTEYIMVSDSCFYNGTSTITIQVTDKDNNAVIRCSVNNANGDVYYNETQPLNVNYKVRKPTITRQPMEDEYLQESSTILLTCNSRGNPQPSYTWYKDGNMDEILNSSNTLYITEVFTNNSGVYRCNVSNNVSGKEYIESTTVEIMIVMKKRTTPVPTTATTTGNESTTDANKDTIVAAVIGITVPSVSIIIIVVVIIRRKKSNSYEKNEEVTRRDKDTEAQSHNNPSFNPNETEKTEEENLNKEKDNQGPNSRNEYASVKEATKFKNRKMPEENQQNSNKDDMEDPYMESKDNTYAHLGEKHQHKTAENAELYDKAGELTDRL